MRYHPFLYDKETYPLDINAYTGTYINLLMKYGFFVGGVFLDIFLSRGGCENIFHFQ